MRKVIEWTLVSADGAFDDPVGLGFMQYQDDAYMRDGLGLLMTVSSRARPPDYDDSSPRRDHQASAVVIALSASRMPSPASPAVAAQCKGIRARAPGSQRYSSRVSGSGAVLS